MIKQKSKTNNRFSAGLIVIVVIISVGIFLFPHGKKNNERGGLDKALTGDYSCIDCNVIIISITNLRNDHLGYNGYFRDTSPNIDNLAANSLIFENTFSPASWTLPAGISLFTSLYPFMHNIMNRDTGQIRLSKNTTTLPDILEEHGYITAAFTGGFDYGASYGLISRFNYTSYPQLNPKHIERYGTFGDNIKNATKWLQKNKDNKFFLFFQGFDTHCPFSVPAENNVFDANYKGNINFSTCLWTFEKVNPVVIQNKTYYNVKTAYSEDAGFRYVKLSERDIYHMVALYDGEIQLVDTLLNKFLDEIVSLGLDKNTIIILLSEHGDLFGEHGRFMRGGPLRGTFYDEVLHVPLLIKHPTLNPKRIDGLVQLIDVAPTLLDFLGIPKEKKFKGKSLMPLIMENKEVNDFVLSGSIFTPSLTNVFFNKSSVVRAVRTKEFKLINEKLFNRNSTVTTNWHEFYNLSKDPNELINVYSATNPDLIDSLKKEFQQMKISR